jgi:hypothetical protein
MTPSTRRAPFVGLFGPPVVVLIVWLIAGLGWTGILLQLAALPAGIVLFRWLQNRPERFSSAEGQSEELVEVEIPSADQTTSFRFSAVVRWHQSQAGPVPVRDAVLRQAGALSITWRPDQVGVAQHHLAAGLACVQLHEHRAGTVSVVDVRLSLSESVQRHLELKNAVLRETELWQLKIELERKVRSYLRDDALQSPESTIVWWLSRNEAGVEHAVELAEILTQLSDLATGRAAPVADELLGGGLIEALERVDQPARRHRAEQVASILEDIGVVEDAGLIRRKFHVEKLGEVVDVHHNGHSTMTAETFER